MGVSNNPKYKNASLYPIGDTANVRGGASLSDDILFVAKKPVRCGLATGNIIQSDADGAEYWLQVLLDNPSTSKYGYVRSDVCTFVNPNKTDDDSPVLTYSGSNGNTLLDTVIKNDKTLYKQLLVFAQVIENMKANNIDTSQVQPIFDSILNDYKTRQTKIANTIGTGVAVEMSLDLIPGGSLFVDLYNKFSSWLSGRLGIAQYAIPIALTAVVTGLVIYALYEMFKPDYERGKVNIQQSALLKKALSSLSPEDQKTVLRDLQTQLDDAYNAGKGNSAGLLTYVKFAAYGVGIFAVVKGGIYIKDKFFSKTSKQT